MKILIAFVGWVIVSVPAGIAIGRVIRNHTEQK